MQKQTIIFVLSIILTSFAASAYGQVFVPASMTTLFEEKWTPIGGCGKGLVARVKKDYSQLDGPDSLGQYSFLLQIKNTGLRDLTFAISYGATINEANQLVIDGDLVDPKYRNTLRSGEMTKPVLRLSTNPAGMFVNVGFLSYSNQEVTYGMTYNVCLRDVPAENLRSPSWDDAIQTDDPFCRLRPVEGCANYRKIKEERAKIKSDPEIGIDLKNEAFGDLPAKGSGNVGSAGTTTGSKNGGNSGTTPGSTQSGRGNTNAAGQQGNGGGQSQGRNSQENGQQSYRYNSICSRNYELILKRMGDTPNYAASYDLFHRDTNKLLMSIAQPCIGYDPKMKEGYEAAADTVRSVNEHCAGSHNRAECTQWGDFGNPQANEKWYRMFEAEAQQAISNPNYSQELTGSVRPASGGSSGGQTGNGTGETGGSSDDSSSAGTDTSGSCQSGLKQIDQESNGILARRPQSASTIAQLQTVLYLTGKVMQHLQAKCQGQPQYNQYAEYKRTYDSTMATCNAIASSPSYCVPKVAW